MTSIGEIVDSRLKSLLKTIPKGLEEWPDDVQECYFEQLSYPERLLLMKELVKISKNIGKMIDDLKNLQ